jgi:N-acetylmuramoyl-L-alanine amidase
MILKKNNIKVLVIHCSDTPDNANLNATDLHKMHIGFGWDGIGYHKTINRKGIIECGRPEYWIGAHAKGINESSLGVCLIGRSMFTDQQFDSLAKVLRNWKEKYPKSVIKGHFESIQTEKTCPNFNVKKWCIERNLI